MTLSEKKRIAKITPNKIYVRATYYMSDIPKSKYGIKLLHNVNFFRETVLQQ